MKNTRDSVPTQKPLRKFYFKCPQCRSNDLFVKIRGSFADLGCALLFFGGLLPYIILRNRAGKKVQCANCLHIFSQPALPTSPLCSFASWTVTNLIICVVLAGIFSSIPELARILPSIPTVAYLEKVIADYPRVAAYLLCAMFLFNAVPSLVVAFISNDRYRRELVGRYRIDPVSPTQIAKERQSV